MYITTYEEESDAYRDCWTKPIICVGRLVRLILYLRSAKAQILLDEVMIPTYPNLLSKTVEQVDFSMTYNLSIENVPWNLRILFQNAKILLHVLSSTCYIQIP